MATLQKFKLLATQCAVAGSPTRSPSASPVIHLRRRKTLRMLLNRPDRRLPRREPSSEIPDSDHDEDQPKKRNEVRVRRKLKDLFVSSPPLEDRVSDKRSNGGGEEERGLIQGTGNVGGGFGNGGVIGGGFVARRRTAGSLRPVTAAFRYRLLRRAWRPVLVTIPE
ncbi:hypothetical protein UlMin_020894 [Ulmus minor]